MKDILKKGLLAGIGLAAMTKEKVEQMADDLAKDLDLSEEEGKKFIESLSKKAEEEAGGIKDMITKEFSELQKKFDFVSGDKYRDLQEKVDKMSDELDELKKKS